MQITKSFNELLNIAKPQTPNKFSYMHHIARALENFMHLAPCAVSYEPAETEVAVIQRFKHAKISDQYAPNRNFRFSLRAKRGDVIRLYSLVFSSRI